MKPDRETQTPRLQAGSSAILRPRRRRELARRPASREEARIRGFATPALAGCAGRMAPYSI
jgi:hypothetical protein